MVPTAQRITHNEACLKNMEATSRLIIAFHHAFERRILGSALQGRLCVQLGHFAALCIAATTTTGFVLIGWTNHFTVRSWPISPYPLGADQGMEKQTGLVTHKHNQERGPVWLCNCCRIGQHTGGECWTKEYVEKAQPLISLTSVFAELHLYVSWTVANTGKLVATPSPERWTKRRPTRGEVQVKPFSI